jgi:hypothetical protein
MLKFIRCLWLLIVPVKFLIHVQIGNELICVHVPPFRQNVLLKQASLGKLVASRPVLLTHAAFWQT